MNFLKSWFIFSPEQDAKSIVERYLGQVGVFSRHQALPLTFQYQLTTSISKCQSSVLFMEQLISQLSITKSVSSSVKLFTIIHNAIYERDYQKDELQKLQQMPIVSITDAEQNKWFAEFCIGYSVYLKKLPSVCDVYRRAKTGKLPSTPQQSLLIEVFRIINQISLLFPSICTSTNVIGRYYTTSYPQFPQFYRMLNKEITMIYSYLKLIIDQILSTYRNLDVEQLKGFIKTMPQIELACDKIEDLLLNKYFKGKVIKGKIYLREEKIQQLCYYLDYQLEGKDLTDHQGDTLSTDVRRENEQIHNTDQQ